ncbi:MAG: hypothetical protein Kow0022_06210 [Phycisphaerales bacterium]
MTNRFQQLPRFLSERARFDTLGPAPALLAHPDWQTRCPWMLWMHGRTANKELDPGRYTRWLRAGIAVCAIDLPAHGQRRDARSDDPSHSIELLLQAVGEIDAIVEALVSVENARFDPSRMGVGGMSLGGMVALRRLCEPHAFCCAAVDASCGALSELYFPADGSPPPWDVAHRPDEVRRADPVQHLTGWRPIPLLAVHSRADRIVPWKTQEHFLNRLRAHYQTLGASPDMVEIVTFERTGAPDEHIGFGQFSNQAKNAQVEFLKRHMHPDALPDQPALTARS